jgi:hypothetical protein
MDRLLATPKTMPVFPSSNGIIKNNHLIKLSSRMANSAGDGNSILASGSTGAGGAARLAGWTATWPTA